MSNIPYYSAEEVEASLKYEELVPALELALADFSKGPVGGVSQPLRATAEVNNYNGLENYRHITVFYKCNFNFFNHPDSCLLCPHTLLHEKL